MWGVKGPPCLVQRICVLTGKSDSWAEQDRLRETGSGEPLQVTGKNVLVKREGQCGGIYSRWFAEGIDEALTLARKKLRKSQEYPRGQKGLGR